MDQQKVEKGMALLRAQGHTTEPRIQFGKRWIEIDRCMLATPQEIEEIADGIYCLEELVELYQARRRDELTASGDSLPSNGA